MIRTIHNYISTCIQFLAMLPMCIAFCCIKKCYQTNVCGTGCYPKGGYNSCGCTYVIIIAMTVFIILFFTFWFEEIFEKIGLLLPCDLISNFKRKFNIFHKEIKNSTCGLYSKSKGDLKMINKKAIDVLKKTYAEEVQYDIKSRELDCDLYLDKDIDIKGLKSESNKSFNDIDFTEMSIFVSPKISPNNKSVTSTLKKVLYKYT